MLSKKVKSHIIKMINKDNINITEAQYEFYSKEVDLKKPSDFMKIHDIDTDEILYHGPRSGILGFEKRKQDPSLKGAAWFCSFGVPHPLSMQGQCDCKLEYDCLPIIFRDRLKEMGFKFDADKQITEEMRLAYKKKYKL